MGIAENILFYRARLVELFCLSIFIVSLPSFEAPKNIFYVTYIVVWVFNRLVFSQSRFSWSLWDLLFFIWVLSGFLVAAISNQGLNEWDGSLDLLRYISVGWLVYRSQYNHRVLTALLVLILGSTFFGAIYSFYLLDGKYFNLYSVGHINHSAIYYAIISGLALSLGVSFWKNFNWVQRVSVFFGVSIFFYFVIQTESRGSILPLFLIFTPLFALALKYLYKNLLTYLILFTVIMFSIAYANDLPVVKKLGKIYDSGIINMSSRARSINSGLLIWRAYPISGVGLENLGDFMTKEKLKNIANNFGLPFSEQKYYVGPHAHNIYANTLAERGIIGFTPLFLILIYWLFLLAKDRPSKEKSLHEVAAWGGALSAFCAVTIGGLFNTTLHHEHGSLAILLLGIWLASRNYTKTTK